MEYTSDFNEVWSLYPIRDGSKGDKRVAFKRYNQAITKYHKEDIINAMLNYSKECELLGKSGTKFTKQFTSWLMMGKGRYHVKGEFMGVKHYASIEINKEEDGIDYKWLNLRYFALKESNGKCCLCGMGYSDGVKLHVDHIKPKSKFPELMYNKDNLQVLCHDCNMGKSNLDDTDWR